MSNGGYSGAKGIKHKTITEDFTGLQFGHVTVLYRIYKPTVAGVMRPTSKYMLHCECGKDFECFANLIQSRGVKSCGCMKNERSITYGAQNVVQSSKRAMLKHVWSNNRLFRCRLAIGTNAGGSEYNIIGRARMHMDELFPHIAMCSGSLNGRMYRGCVKYADIIADGDDAIVVVTPV